MGLRFHCGLRLVVSALVCLCHNRTQNPSDCAYRRHQLPKRCMDRTTITRSNAMGRGPKYLIHDRDGKFGPLFTAVADGSGTKEVETPARTPQANGICERLIGSLRRECLDHVLVHDDKHLQRVVTEYTTYFNEDRPHQGIGQRIPNHFDLPTSKPSGRIRSRAILGGLHHSYSRATDLN